MPLHAHMIDSTNGPVEPELTAHLDDEHHDALFTHAEISSPRFPLLARLTDLHSSIAYAPDELESLISELEQAAAVLGPDSPARRFLSPFHSLCCAAFFREKSVVLSAR